MTSTSSASSVCLWPAGRFFALHVVRLSLCATSTLVTNEVQRSPTASAALMIRPQAPTALVRLHQTLAHCGVSTIHRLLRAGVIRCPDPTTRTSILAATVIDCKHCAASANPSKAKTSLDRHLPPSSPDRTGVWSSDLFGPFARSAGGATYGCILVCHHRHYYFFGALRAKSDQSEWFQANHPWVEAEANDAIKILLTDGGGEFVNATMTVLPRRTCPSGVFLFWVRHGVVNSDTYDKQVPRWPWWGFPSSSFRASSSFKNIFK